MTDTAAAPSRRRENTRTRLMDAAAEMFAEVGIDAASVEAVCERAGFTRGAFYSNFASKEELFLALCARSAETTIAAVRDRVTSIEDRGLDSAGDVMQLVQEVLEATGEDRLDVLLGAETRLQALRNPGFAEAYLALNQGLGESVTQLVRDIADARGLSLRVPADVATELLLSVWVSTSETALLTRQAPAESRSGLAERLSQVVGLILE
ncbi:AcrR family transcriptional regulator [Microbacterium sp. SORGH_AS 1204]|uniref:TetR/AcrR family transcriptional regulator n=1 Tax=Microbacterium sp. SORGH_AS_1204 TaxID=3041785 RepID=UPI00278F2F56|nr:TetR/AcrR family transcriptional regulator [Microbacterium sp. SORGH_AS_1204]MDQ1135838.1 AcrR family transcriptional regulator [Microbacterium sp. SORGH_AS_1204]